MTDSHLCKTFNDIYMKLNLVQWRIQEFQNWVCGTDTIEFLGSGDFLYSSHKRMDMFL